jgi:hypothetical protein
LAVPCCLALLFGCTRPADRDRFEPTGERLVIERTIPTQGEIGIDPAAPLVLCLSGLIDPGSVGELDAVLTSGPRTIDTELRVQLIPWTLPSGAPADPLDPPWCRGSVLTISPKEILTDNVHYRLALQPSAIGWSGEQLDVEQPGWIEDADGAPLFLLEFETKSAAAMRPANDPAPVPFTDLFAADGVLNPQHRRCSCHTDQGTLAHSLLDLSSAPTAFMELVGDPRLRDTGYPMIVPRRPSESFLLHKLVRDQEGAVRGVLGDAMPPDRPFDYELFVMLARWIETGAAL